MRKALEIIRQVLLLDEAEILNLSDYSVYFLFSNTAFPVFMFRVLLTPEWLDLHLKCQTTSIKSSLFNLMRFIVVHPIKFDS